MIYLSSRLIKLDIKQFLSLIRMSRVSKDVKEPYLLLSKFDSILVEPYINPKYTRNQYGSRSSLKGPLPFGEDNFCIPKELNLVRSYGRNYFLTTSSIVLVFH